MPADTRLVAGIALILCAGFSSTGAAQGTRLADLAKQQDRAAVRTLIASGADVWAGILDSRPAGACTSAFQIFSTTRIVAGGPIEGGVFKCARKSVATALADGTYAPWVPTAADVTRLGQIFPTGVCDYSKPDVGRPAGY